MTRALCFAHFQQLIQCHISTMTLDAPTKYAKQRALSNCHMIHATLMIFFMPCSLQRHFVFGKWQFAAAKAAAAAVAVLHAREGGSEGGDL